MIPPTPMLAEFVRQLRVEEPCDPAGQYRVMPGPFPVIGFQLSGRIAVVRDAGNSLLDRSGITGLQESVRHFGPVGGPTRTLLLTLEPWAAYATLGCEMHHVAGAHVSLSALLPAPVVREAEERLAEARSEGEMAAVIASLLRARRAPHPAVVQAARHILASDGAGDGIEAVARHVAMSRRQLERLFRAQIGVRPKEFASLVRFNWVLRNMSRRRSWSDLACAAGYADQAHFIRGFKRMAGVTPQRFN